jgi:beta-lactamase regulating signal transducer with metallopeptidase domain
MAPVLLHLHSVPAFAADLLIASVWQGLVIAVGVALLLRLMPGLTAAIRSAIWTAVLLMVVVFPAFSLALHSGNASAAPSVGLWHASDRWSLALFGVWLAFSLLRVVQLIGSAVYLQAVAARAKAIQPAESVASLLRGSRRRVQVCLSAEVDRPSVTGFFRPRILLSPELLAALSPRELQQVILHEMEHLRRYDDWTNLLQKLSLALVPLHPVLLWLDRQMCVERERACDDSVLRHTHARKAYAACLARLAEDSARQSIVRRGFSLALGALGRRKHQSELAGRVHRILDAPQKRMSRRAIWMATAVLLAGVFTGATELARAPQLVSFDETAGPLTAAAAPSGFRAAPEPARFQRASFHPARNSMASVPHTTLLKAIMPQRPQPTVFSARPRPSPALRRPHRARLASAIRRTAVVHAPDRSFTLAAWHPANMPPPRLTLTVAEYPQATQFVQDPRFFYAAVPLQDGWLIIQL